MTAERDWADREADDILSYLAKCHTSEQEAELIAAHLRLQFSRGKMAGTEEVGKILGVQSTGDKS